MYAWKGASYQVAHNNLALSNRTGGLGRRGLDAAATHRAGGLLDASDRSGLDRLACSRAAADRAAAAGGAAALGREDLIERLIKLARHFGGDGR